MKRVLAIAVVLLVVCSSVLTTFAADGKVTYDGKAKEFIFQPGSDNSLTDLFPNFKDVMPGDVLTQKITVNNDADKQVKVKIYLRSLGAQADSVEFLSQLDLRVQRSKDNDMAYMFDAAAHETAQLTDWVCLGTLYSGGRVDLDVTLNVPVELDNVFQKQIGYLDWEFKVEEFPVEESDPDAPQTGDNRAILWIALVCAVVCVCLLLLFSKKRNK